MNLWLRVATSGTQAWCKAYTRGLPAAVRQARLDELGSDMWEQRSHAQQQGEDPSDTGFSILTRLLCGMPSDLVWRQSAANGLAAAVPGPVRKDGKMFAQMFVAFSTAAAVVFGLFAVMNGVGSILGHAGDESKVMWGLFGIIGGVLLLASVALAGRSPRKAAISAIAGALVLAWTYLWLAVSYPLAIVLIAGAVVRAIRAKGPAPATP